VNRISRWSTSAISNACVIRVTNQCDQRCDHCCFRSGPENVGHMSVEMCKRLNSWIPPIVVMNIMGGEFTILRDYPDMLLALAKGRDHIRMVTNGFWAHDKLRIRKFMSTMEQLVDVCGEVDVAVSGDKWHTKSGQPAMDILADNDVGVNYVRHDYVVDLSPIGRAWDNKLEAEQNTASCLVMCNMMIREDGMICRCPYGYFPLQQFEETSWYNAREQIWHWRAERLRKDVFCVDCMEEVSKTTKLPTLVQLEVK